MKVEQHVTLTRAEFNELLRNAYQNGQYNGQNVTEDRWERDQKRDTYLAQKTEQVWG